MNIKHRLIIILQYLRMCARWALFSVITGIACGALGGAFSMMVAWSNELRGQYPWLLFLLPFAGGMIVYLYHMFGFEEDRGAGMIFDSVRNDDKVPFHLIIVSFLATISTHLFGGSAGRVGVAIQMGGGVSSWLSEKVGLSQKDRSLFIMCGMAGLISALFGTPLMATFLSMEVINIGVIYYAALLPCLLTSLTACFFVEALRLEPMQYVIEGAPSVNALSIAQVSTVSIAAALVSIIFCVFMAVYGYLLKKNVKNEYYRILIGAGLVVVLTLLLGSQRYNGSGAALLDAVFTDGMVFPYDFLLKILFTGITLQSGYKGGGVFPALIIGSTFGCFFGPIVGLSPTFGAAIGMIAVFCGSVNCPIASIFFGAEVFGTRNLLFFAIAAAISFVFSGYFTIFPGQRFVFSKLRMEYKQSGLREGPS